jgi:dihydroneopterin aldolase
VNKLNNPKLDILSCRGIAHQCEIGFHDIEAGKLQKIEVNFDAYVQPIGDDADSIEAIKLDYFEANSKIEKLLKKEKVNLIETLAERIAKLLLNDFDIKAVMVEVIKYPVNSVISASYQCYREK